MIKVDNIAVFNIRGAIRGMRNPLNSWHLSDSKYDENTHIYIVGEKDIKLAQNLLNGGADDAKFMRQIMVSMDITAPLYWWKEMDQYKVATTTNSTSTMHKLSSTPIGIRNFSFDEDFVEPRMLQSIIDDCESLRQKYLETNDLIYWRALVQLLPEAWNQTRTWTANYQVLRNIYFARKNHKLTEWRDFCDMIVKLPYGKELICYKREEK